MPTSKRTPEKARGSDTRSADSSEARPAAPRPPARTRGTHEPARRGADPQRVRNDGDSRQERGGGLSQGDRASQRDPGAVTPRTSTNTGGAATGAP